MKDEVRTQHWMFRGALPASVAVHLLIGALLIFGLPVPFSQSQEEQTIEVDLVPPPEPSEKAEAEPPPPAEEPEPEKAQEENAAAPKPAGNESARNSPTPVIQPVIQFGEKDDGPRETPNGDSTEDASATPAVPDDPEMQDLESPATTELTATGQTSASDMPTPTPRPAEPIKEQEVAELQEAKKLFSQTATGNLTATTAMNNVPRDVRAGRLCVTELREQLLNASPPYFPELLPSDRLKEGTVIELPGQAFRTGGQWFNLSYRCEVDADAMRVVSFAFRVGDRIPRSEWQRRGLPSQ